MSDDICVKCHSVVGLEPGLEWDDEDEKMCHPCEIDSLRAEVSSLTQERDRYQREAESKDRLWRKAVVERSEARAEVSRLREALESIASAHKPEAADKDYWLGLQLDNCADVLAFDTRLAREALR